MITAPGLATKARQAFERAALLNPDNLEAHSDLFILYEDERAHFRGTTSFRRTSPHQRTHHPDSSPFSERSIGSRYNGLTHANLLFTTIE